MTDQLDYRLKKKDKQSQIANQQLRSPGTDRLTEMRVEIHQQTTALRAEHFTKIGTKTDERMRQIQSNEVRPEQMQCQTVEEKLEKTCSTACRPSFEHLLFKNNFRVYQQRVGRNADSGGMSELLIKFFQIRDRVGLW